MDLSLAPQTGDSLTLTPMGELTETQTVVLRYVRGRVARREIQRNTAGRVRSILMGFAESYGKRPLKLIGRKHIELWLEDGRGGISNSRIGQLIRAWMEHAGVKSRAGDGRAAHSLRHTMATDVVAREPDLRVVQQILGHQSLTSTQVYLKHAELPRLRAAMERSA